MFDGVSLGSDFVRADDGGDIVEFTPVLGDIRAET